MFLRNLEHRLQYLDDQQTQMLPANPEDLAAVARAMGCADAAHAARGARAPPRLRHPHFEAVFAGAAADNGEHPLAGLWTGSVSGEEAQARLRALGYEDAARVLERVRELRDSAAVPAHVGLDAGAGGPAGAAAARGGGCSSSIPAQRSSAWPA